jgi:hypothetical protein
MIFRRQLPATLPQQAGRMDLSGPRVIRSIAYSRLQVFADTHANSGRAATHNKNAAALGLL